MYGDELRKESERGSNGYLRKKMGSVLFERVEASRMEFGAKSYLCQA